MLTSWESIVAAQKQAFDMLICPFALAPATKSVDNTNFFTGQQMAAMYPNFAYLINDDSEVYQNNVFITEPSLVTGPAILKQELPLTLSSNYKFIFAANSSPDAGFLPNTTIYANNMVLDKNDIAAVYGVRFRIGYGDANGQTRVYQTYEAIPGDGFIYNSKAQLQVESETQMTLLNMNDFREVPQGSVNAAQKYDGMMLINPIRILAGQLGKLFISFQPFNPSLSSLTISADAVVECSLLIVSGQASAGSN